MNNDIEWRINDDLVPYPESLAFMEARANGIRLGNSPEIVWLLEHPPLYTAGTSAKPEELLEPLALPIYKSGRGGKYTYHGPGQRVAYVMLDIKKRDQDIRRFISDLEEWIIQALANFNVIAERREGRVGIWVPQGAPSNPAYREDKIAAIGIRIRQWVSFHGVSINVEPELSRFEGIIPCGVQDHGVTSLHALGYILTISELDAVLRSTFEDVFQRRTINYIGTNV